MPRLSFAFILAALLGTPVLAATPIPIQTIGGLHVASADTATGQLTDDALFGRGSAEAIVVDLATGPALATGAETGLLTR